MLITEWQEKFLRLVTEGKYNVFPPAMIRALLADPESLEAWTAMANEFFAPYEGLTITVSGLGGAYKGLTPASLRLDLSQVVAPEALQMETGEGITGEDGSPITEE